MALASPPPQSPARASAWRRRWGRVAVVLAVVAIIASSIVAVRGLLADPVRSRDGAGVATLAGTFQPYRCAPGSCRGYVQAGGRSVFVVLPGDCPPPTANSEITVRARAAPALGVASYIAVGCPSPGG